MGNWDSCVLETVYMIHVRVLDPLEACLEKMVGDFQIKFQNNLKLLFFSKAGLIKKNKKSYFYIKLILY